MLKTRMNGKFSILIAAFFALFVTSAMAEENAADHEQLRGLLTKAKQAVNSGNYDNLNDLFYKKFSATLIDQELVTNREQLQAYFNKWFKGDKAIIKKVSIDPVADGTTEIYDGKYGVVHGTSTENYELAGGKTYTFMARWTATVIKDGGQWKIRALHTGINFADNAILTAVEKSLYYFAAGGVVVGLIAGFMFGRRRKS